MRQRWSPWSVASLVGVAFLLVLIAVFSRDAGVAWDEPLQVEYGERVLRWFTSGWVDQSAMGYQELKVYGGLFDAVAQLIAHRSPVELYQTRHVLSALLALVGVIAAGATASRIAGPRAGFLAGATLALTPPWIGHGLFNPKDIPFGAAAAVVSYTAVGLATGSALPRWRDTLWASVALGIALAFRPGGAFLAAYPFLGVGVAVIAHQLSGGHDRRPMAWVRTFTAAGIRMLPVVPIAWVLMIAVWPWAHLHPLRNPWEAIAGAAHFTWHGVMLFGGTMVGSLHLPLSYLPTWFALTTPEIYLVALTMGVVALARLTRPSARVLAGMSMIGMTIALPSAGVVATRPVIYDGLRHFLFLFPMGAVVAGVAISAFLDTPLSRIARLAGLIALAAAAGVVVYDIVTLHPYEYVYFNRLSGGLKAADGRYETDYWGVSYREGLEWALDNFVGPHPDHVIPIMSCDFASNPRIQHYHDVWPGVKQRSAIVDKYERAEVYLAVTRYDCHKRPGTVMHTVSRQGVPLLYVIRTPTPGS